MPEIRPSSARVSTAYLRKLERNRNRKLALAYAVLTLVYLAVAWLFVIAYGLDHSFWRVAYVFGFILCALRAVVAAWCAASFATKGRDT